MRMRLPALAILVLLLVTSALPASAVTYGIPDGEAHPYVGLAVFYHDGEPLRGCSGTLISPTVFLTAAHCAFGADEAKIWFGSDLAQVDPIPDPDTTGTPFSHPDFANFEDLPNTYDVGVVLLDPPMLMPAYGALPELGRSDSLATQRGQQDVTFTLVGYGTQEVKPQLIQVPMRVQGTLHVLSLRSALTDGYNLKLSSNPGTGGGICLGDSGGPVFYGDSNVIAGINSFVMNDNCKGTGYVYRTDIAETLEFVDDYLTE